MQPWAFCALNEKSCDKVTKLLDCCRFLNTPLNMAEIEFLILAPLFDISQ